MNEWGLDGFRIGSNGPYWSLSYEVAYYILFGLVFYLAHWWRWPLVALVAILFGPAVLALSPAWLMGSALYWLLKKTKTESMWVSCVIFLFPLFIYVLCQYEDLPSILLQNTRKGFGRDLVSDYLRFSDQFIWNFLLGILITMHFFGAAQLSRWLDTHQKISMPAFEKVIRWFAKGSFSIYLVHYPLMQVLNVILPGYSSAGSKEFWHGAALLGLTLLLCLVFAQGTERQLPRLKRLFTT